VPSPLAFGPFEVNTAPPELLKGGVRIRLSGQPFQILLALLARPGDLVTREQLRDEVWNKGTFVDFEHGLNAAMNKLRRALSDSAEAPRYIETVPGQGYRFIATLEKRHFAPVPGVGKSAILQDRPGRLSVSFRWWLLATAACLTVSFALGWWLRGSQDGLPSWSLIRLTADAGLTGSPALSPDGKLVAYSSDRSLDGEQDLYIRQVAGGETIRLTLDGAGNTTPDFSPDGTRIVFRSERNGGGIYEIPALGGEARLLAHDGLNPKYSPDGSQVAYWTGAEGVSAAVPGGGAVWVVPVSGGEPRRLGPNFTAARYPIWIAGGKRLLCVGYTSAKAYETSSLDWWFLDLNSGGAVKTGTQEALARGGLQVWGAGGAAYNLPRAHTPGCWSATNTVVFSDVTGDTHSLWEVGISPRTGKVSGVPRRLTTGADNEVEPSCASNGAIAFSNMETRTDFWSLPFDLDHGTSEGGTSKGALERITHSPASREYASLSGDGRYVAFASNQAGRLNIWRRDVATGQESHVANSPFVQRFPVSNASGSRIAFSVYERDKRVVYAAAPGGAPEKLCEGCLRATSWSRDEKTMLVFGGNPYQINTLDLATHRQSPLLKHRDRNLLYARFSPDNRWVSFTDRIQTNRGRIMIAPVDGPKPVPESAWITIAEAGVGINDWANWSPDGRTLYFTSAIDGHNCMWGQRLDGSSRRPVGEAFAVQHLHGRLAFQQEGGWSAASDRIGLVLAEATGNIWVMSHAGAH
jgi:eukaryotic-like serine/threonine-protein kinase